MFTLIESEQHSQSCVIDCGNEFVEKLSNDHIQQSSTRTDLCFPFIRITSQKYCFFSMILSTLLIIAQIDKLSKSKQKILPLKMKL